MTIRRRKGNPANSFRASITASRAPVARRSSASITKRTSDAGAKRLSGPTTCLSKLPSRCCSAYGVSFPNACCASPNQGTDRANCSARMRASSCEVVAPARTRRERSLLRPRARQRCRQRRLAPTGLAHHRHATLNGIWCQRHRSSEFPALRQQHLLKGDALHPIGVADERNFLILLAAGRLVCERHPCVHPKPNSRRLALK